MKKEDVTNRKEALFRVRAPFLRLTPALGTHVPLLAVGDRTGRERSRRADSGGGAGEGGRGVRVLCRGSTSRRSRGVGRRGCVGRGGWWCRQLVGKCVFNSAGRDVRGRRICGHDQRRFRDRGRVCKSK